MVLFEFAWLVCGEIDKAVEMIPNHFTLASKKINRFFLLLSSSLDFTTKILK